MSKNCTTKASLSIMSIFSSIASARPTPPQAIVGGLIFGVLFLMLIAGLFYYGWLRHRAGSFNGVQLEHPPPRVDFWRHLRVVRLRYNPTAQILPFRLHIPAALNVPGSTPFVPPDIARPPPAAHAFPPPRYPPPPSYEQSVSGHDGSSGHNGGANLLGWSPIRERAIC